MMDKKSKILCWLMLMMSLFGIKAAVACEEVSQDSKGNLWCYSNCAWNVLRDTRQCDISAITLEESRFSEDKYATPDSLREGISKGTYRGTPTQLEKQMLATTATVNQTTCSTQGDVSFEKLTSHERILIRSAVDAFVYGEAGPKELGCSIYDEGVSCEAFGYICWIDSDTSGCAKDTC